MGLEDRLKKLEEGRVTNAPNAGDEHEEEARLVSLREAAQQANESYLRNVVWARVCWAELTEEYEDLEEEMNVSDRSAEAIPPFTINEEDGRVYCSRDGKPVTSYHQTLAEPWYWEFVEEARAAGGNPRGLIHDEDEEAFYMPEYPYELAFSRERLYLNRYFWALGGKGGNPSLAGLNPAPPRLSPERAQQVQRS